MNTPPALQRTLLFVHAHPDDEALLTAGTMAKASAHGHRVILLVATDGAAGLTSAAFSENLAQIRRNELHRSAGILGVDHVIAWNFADSGLHGENSAGFSHLSPEDLANRLREVIEVEEVDTVIGYDPSGGYGHPDHVQVHNVTRLAVAQHTANMRLFEATLPREPIATAVRWAAALHVTPQDFDATEFSRAWTPRADITHRINVRDYLDSKKSAIASHASQAHADGSMRTLAVLSRLPRPLFATLMGTEYFVEVTDHLN